MKTGARDNSAAFRSRPAGNFTGEPIGARRVDRGTIAAIGTVERGTGAVSENAGTRDARDARGDTRDRTRRRERGRAETIFDEGRGRSRARGRGTGPRARPVRHPPRLLKKVPLRANVSGAFGKMAFEASDGTGRPSRCDRARAGSGGYSRDIPLTRPRTRVSRSTRAVCRARRAVSVDPAVKRSRRICGAFSRRNPRRDGARSPPPPPNASRVRSRVHARDGRRLAYLRDTRARAFPRSPPGVGTRCVVPARRARTQVTGWWFSSGSFTENPMSPRPQDAVNGVF